MPVTVVATVAFTGPGALLGLVVLFTYRASSGILGDISDAVCVADVVGGCAA